ncbi:amino acid adenylation domain-containing protein [Plectonema cf. radiosum LEGE 06105]|uniref:Amino acid adenylation domain-containing protein n=1 Tax=Plectonema cf. radiosum LEGE 06105 TaxID=945769 RepID=A0A8J7F178_9CYAN|nr:non-ribosomal peptide synthetase [Plectonema radiosum]MBE9212897.1 amino acid adenylation domain-containing protein [Plectonema cf. radiosum LEGE 06105]
MDNIYEQLTKLTPEQRKLFKRRLKERGIVIPDNNQIYPRESGDELPLSFAQQRLWFIQQLEPESSTYNVPSALKLKGKLNVGVLEKSLNEIIRRHEILRTTFISNSQKEPVQKIAVPEELSLPVVDLQGLLSREDIVRKLVRDAYESPFDLTKPLLRLSLIKLSEFEHILLITTHHIISDRWSIGVFLRELSSIYNAFCDRKTISGGDATKNPLNELPIQYGDFAIWQRQWLQGEVLENQTNYWKEKLNNLSVLELPTDRKRLPVPSYKGAHYPLSLSQRLSEKLRNLSAKSGVTLFTMLLSAFQVLLHRYTHQDDIVVGTDIANRDRTEIEPLIGLLVNTLVLRTDVSGNPTFRELLQRVREVVLGAFAHKDLPFEKLVEILNPNRDISQMMPLFQVKFDLQLASVKPLQLNNLTVERDAYKQEFVKYELRLNLQDTEKGICGQVEYSSDLFDEETIVRLVEHFRVLLGGIVDNPDCHIGNLPLLSEAESKQILWEWNQTQREYEDLCIHELFALQVEKTPDAIALVHDDCHLTYRELNKRANQLAHYLQTLGVKPESKVGVYFERNLELVIGILAILKAGAAYVPLDPTYPEARTAYIIEDAQIEILLTETSPPAPLLGKERGAGGRLVSPHDREKGVEESFSPLLDKERGAGGGVRLFNDWEKIAQHSTDNPKSQVTADNLAYLIYTSGSTGKPKGVAIAHRSTVTLLHWAREVFNDQVIAGMLASTSICFDLSVFELFVPLSWGGKIILVENVLDLVDLPGAWGITTINTVPSAISQLSRVNAIPNSVNTINLAGEALQWSLVQQLEKHPYIQQIFNLYGPSEDTIYSTYALVGGRGKGVGRQGEKELITNYQLPITNYQSPPIGFPIANTQAYILDSYLQPVPVGVIGELYLGGAGLARGYFNKPDLTAQRFIPNRFNSFFTEDDELINRRDAESAEEEGREKKIPNSQLPISRLYKTGDLVRYLADGNIEYIGRLDSQVKIRGYRIEIGEVEAALSQYPQVQESAVNVREEGENKLLVAYVVFKDDLEISISQVRNFLSERLPVYMIPAAFVELDELPRLPNGKINRRKLPLPDTIRRELKTTFIQPQTEIEKAIAKIWQDELKVEQVGLHDNFFELGGHSLLGIKIIAEINQCLQVDIPLRSLFLNPTVAGLVEQVENNSVIPNFQSLPKLVPDLTQRYEPFPLTDIQQAYWIGRNKAFELGNVSTHGYREIETVGLSVQQVEVALQQLINRHDMLRVIVESDGKQRILPQVPPYKIKTLNLCASSVEEVDKELTNLRDKLSHQVLSTEEYPLFDIQAVLLSDDRVRFLISFDVLMGDAWSLQILAQELVLLIQQSNKFPPLEISFRDYVLAENEFRNSDKYQQSWNYWLSRLTTLPPAPQLPLQKNPNAIKQPRFIRRTHTLKPELWGKIKQLATQNNITPSGLLLAAFAEILTLWSNNPQFTLNLTLFNRLPLHPQVNQLIGDFTSSTLLAIDNSGKDIFATRAKRIQEQLWSDLDHRYVSGVEVLRRLARTKGRMTGALMPVVFTSTLTQDNSEKSSRNRNWDGEVVYSVSQTSQVYLDHQVSEINGALVYNWDTIDELFPSGMLDDMFTTYSRFLESLANQAAWQNTTRQLLPSTQLEIFNRVNATQANLINTQPLLHELFFDRVALNPDKQAIITSNVCFSYQELRDRTLYLTTQLQELGLQNQLIAVVMSKGWEQVVAVLGILTAGAAYVPIDPELPRERRSQILQQAQIEYVVIQPWLDNSDYWEDGITRIVVENSMKNLTPSFRTPLSLVRRGDGGEVTLESSQLAYIIYTSGSTGLPKGVMINHQGAVNTILDINQRFGITQQDCVLALSSLSFDLSVYDIFGTLAAGATIVIPDADLAKDSAHWTNLIQEYHVTIWNSVPALMQLLVEHLESVEQKTNSLRLVLMSGDWIPLNLPQRIWNQLTNAEIISLGGATEASIWSIAYPIKEINPSWKSIPYGYPLTNQQFYVLNEAMEPCPIWVTGQLYISGIGLAKGYLNQPQLTAEKFIPNPFVEETSPRPDGHPSPYQGEGKGTSPRPDGHPSPYQGEGKGVRLYKTGDLGRYLPDGSIEFLGREDFQVKVNGYRIELGEIETVLLKNPLIQEAVVTAVGNFDNQLDNKQLVAYIVPNPVEKIDFKLQQLGIRKDEGEKQIELPQLERDENINQAYLRRQSYRQFLQQPINLNQFSQWIGSLAQMQLKDFPLPKYRYGSAGSLYPVQAYLYVKNNRIAGLEPGIYYYHPAKHNLTLLHQESVIDNQVYSGNQAIFEESGFSLFLIAELAAITPVYGDKAKDFCLLEAGYISQLLMETAPDFKIGLCPIGVLEFERIREWFNLEPSQILLHSFVGGKIEQTWTQQWMSSETPQQSMSISERLRQYLQQKLPDYMVPSHYMLLDTLPLTSNGKIDRRALPKPQLHGQIDVEYVAAKTELEKAIAQIWRNALKLEQIGIHDNFFELGGNSLSATQVITQMRQILQVEITIRHFFEAPTIAEQAQVIEQQPKQISCVETIKKVERNNNQEILENLEEISEEDVDALLKQMMEE